MEASWCERAPVALQPRQLRMERCQAGPTRFRVLFLPARSLPSFTEQVNTQYEALTAKFTGTAWHQVGAQKVTVVTFHSLLHNASLPSPPSPPCVSVLSLPLTTFPPHRLLLSSVWGRTSKRDSEARDGMEGGLGGETKCLGQGGCGRRHEEGR